MYIGLILLCAVVKSEVSKYNELQDYESYQDYEGYENEDNDDMGADYYFYGYYNHYPYDKDIDSYTKKNTKTNFITYFFLKHNFCWIPFFIVCVGISHHRKAKQQMKTWQIAPHFFGLFFCMFRFFFCEKMIIQRVIVRVCVCVCVCQNVPKKNKIQNKTKLTIKWKMGLEMENEYSDEEEPQYKGFSQKDIAGIAQFARTF